jgi:hypothetical protein
MLITAHCLLQRLTSHELPARGTRQRGTTLLLVGIVVLLERRIVDNAVRTFRNAAEEARARMRDDFRIQVQDFTDRVNAEWAAASREDVDAMKERTKRLSKKLADN